jgi:hypothetical protein
VIGRQDERGCPDLLKAIDRRRLQLFISALVVGERVQIVEAIRRILAPAGSASVTQDVFRARS